jgi:peptide/nickel transport system permease protein
MTTAPPGRHYGPAVLVARKLAALAATILLAPAFSFIVFETLSAETFAPGTTLAGLADWYGALLLHGDLGEYEDFDMPLTQVLYEGLPADLVMLAGGLAFGLGAGSAAGLVAVARPRSRVARVLDLLAGVGVSMPVYWMGFALLMLIASNTGSIVRLPFVSGYGQYDDLPSDPLAFALALWVPCVIVGSPIAAGVYRMTLGASRELLGEDFVRTAYAKGLRQRQVMRRHILPVAAIPVLVLAASQVNLLITNVALVQVAFNIPGGFREVSRAFANGNTMLMQALVLEGCILIALANTAADLLQAKLDPRLRDPAPVR